MEDISYNWFVQRLFFQFEKKNASMFNGVCILSDCIS